MNAQQLMEQVANDTYTQIGYKSPNTTITKNLNNIGAIDYFKNPFNKLNSNANAIDLANANAEMLLNQNKYKYYHDEALANTAVQRRVADVIKAGLNPYIANGLFGGNGGFGGEVPNAAAIASSGESKQKADWKTFIAQSGMNMLNQIMSGVMSGFSLYQTQKALMKAREEAKEEKKKPKNDKDVNLDPSYGEVIKDNLVNGATGLRDGLMEMEKMIPAILGALFGNFNPNWN